MSRPWRAKVRRTLISTACVSAPASVRFPAESFRTTTAGREQHVLPGEQIEAGVARTGIGRERQVGIELHHGDFEHGRIVGTS